MEFAVITGTSRGLGWSIARFFLEAGVHVIGVSRNVTEDLQEAADENNVTFRDYRCDLSDVKDLDATFQKVMNKVYANEPESVYLVNNAGMVEPIDQAKNQASDQLSRHIHVNTIAPMVITNLFLEKGTELGIPLIALMITSGAAENPTYGWSAYCSSKASVNMYVKTVALEQNHLQTNHKIIAFSPGVMDTGMQNKIRESSEAAFKDVDRFREYKKANRLADVDMVGSVIVDVMNDYETIENGKIYNIADYT